jgi:adenylosuccinate synthase
MAVTAVVGANWGDEGKGKIIDALAAESDYVVRFQGGSNAGHTVINSYGKFALHLLPSGVFHPAVGNVIGPGVALDVEVLQAELQMLAERGVPAPRLHISDRAQIVLPIHRLLDGLEEERLGSKSFGSTRRGIAPFYADKYLKLGIQAAELADGRTLQVRLQQLLAQKNVLLPHLYGQQPIDPVVWAEALAEQGRWLAPYLCNTTELLRKAWSSGANILLEGQLGALRDPDHGIYPFSTSSSTLAGYAPVGAGLPRMPSAVSQPSSKPIPVVWAQVPSSANSLAAKGMSCAAAAEMQGNMAPPPDARGVWAGSTQLPPGTAA